MIKTAQEAYLAGRQAAMEKLSRRISNPEWDKSNDYYQEGREHLQQGNKSEALKAWTKAVEINAKITRGKWNMLFPDDKRLKGSEKKALKDKFEENLKKLKEEINNKKNRKETAPPPTPRVERQALPTTAPPPTPRVERQALPTTAPPPTPRVERQALPTTAPPPTPRVERQALPTTALNIASVLAGTAGGSYLGGFTPRSLGVSLGGAAVGNLLGGSAGAAINAYTGRESELVPLVGSTTGAIGGGLAAGKYLS